MSTGYRRPQGGNAFARYAGTNREVHPLEVDYKKLKVGGRVRLRFLDLTDEVAVVLEGREVAILNKQNNSMMAIKMEIPTDKDGNPDPGLKGLVDHAGTPILACKKVNIYRCPVWVYFEQDDTGKVTEIGALRYIEFTQGLRDSMGDLAEFQNGVGAFNEDTGRPDYDVDLCVVKGEGTIPKNYKFDVVYMDAKTKKTHPNFGVEAEEVLADVMDEINDLWEDVINAMNRRTTLEDVIKRLAPPKEGRATISARPSVGRAEENAEQESWEEPPARPSGRKYGGR
jgi:hypothetical protein